MCKQHKPDDCKLEDNQVEKQEENHNGFKLTVSLAAISDDDESVKLLPVLWFFRIWGSVLSGLLTQQYLAKLHWINSSSH